MSRLVTIRILLRVTSRALALQRGVSESQDVREAVDFSLAAEEVMAAIRELHERGGLDDVFGRLPDEVSPATTVD